MCGVRRALRWYTGGMTPTYGQQATLVVVVRDGQVLLGMKKRGFGAGKWNGFGGKVESGETVAAAAMRELREECGITAHSVVPVAVHDFAFDGNPVHLPVAVFLVTDFAGEPNETDEMRPQWFAVDAIPYDTMWVDDRYWLPRVLAGERLACTFTFSADGGTILSKEIRPVPTEAPLPVID